MKPTDKQCNHTEWFTPPHIMERVHTLFSSGFYDPANAENNPTRALFFNTQTFDGLESCWKSVNLPVFLNPPYGKALPRWVQKVGEETRKGTIVLTLLPGNRTETKYFHRHIFISQLKGICYVRKRLRFLNYDREEQRNNPFASIFYLFNYLDFPNFNKVFSVLGKCLKVEC